ncbi:MAG: LpxD N-terminal domain-containing protein, partial [Verrucomicrobiales bacterium]
MEVRLDQLASLVDGEILRGQGDAVLTGFASLADAQSGDLSFCTGQKYFGALRNTLASAVFVERGFALEEAGGSAAAIVAVDNPTRAFSSTLKENRPAAVFEPGVHPSAVVAQSAEFDPENVSIG